MNTPRIRSPFYRAAANFRVVPRAAQQDEAEILLYDEIGFFGVEAQSFVRDLNAITAKTIHLRINSPGGSVFDGVAIYNALKAHPAKVIVHVDALAASMASVIALAGDEVRMADNAFLMIHEPWTLAIGNAADLRKDADLLEKISTATILPAYVAKTGQSEEQVKAWMADETWFTAAEAKEHGFIDAIDTASTLKAAFDLSVFAKAPAALAEPDAEPSKREVERILRDAGFSRDDAKALVSGGYDALTQRDVADDAEWKADVQALIATLAA